MQSILRCAFATALLGAFPIVAWAQSSAPPDQGVQAPSSAAPAPSQAPSSAPEVPTTTPETINIQPTLPATLQFDTTDPGARYEVTVVDHGATRYCATPVQREHPCTITGLTPGSARVHVTGSATFERDVDVESGNATATLHYEAPANGMLAGAILLLMAAVSAGGAAAIIAVCGVGTSCGNDAYDAWAVPLALLTPAFLIGGFGMMAWRRPASSSVEVVPTDASLAARSNGSLRLGLSAAPLPGGAAIGLAAQF